MPPAHSFFKKKSILKNLCQICGNLFFAAYLEVVLIYVENSFTCFFAMFFPGFLGQIVLLSFSKSRKNSDRKIFIKFMTNKFKTTS